MIITEVSEPIEDDFLVLKNGLNGFNKNYTGSLHSEKVLSFVKDEYNKTLGGILGGVNRGWLYIERLWLSDSIWSKGLGSKLHYKL